MNKHLSETLAHRILRYHETWSRGCSSTIGDVDEDYFDPEHCPECTRAFVDAVVREATKQAAKESAQ